MKLIDSIKKLGVAITSFMIVIIFHSVEAQETVTGGFMWTYDLPDKKDTQFQRVQIDFKYELFTEKIGDQYKVWAKYTFSPQFTHIMPERGGIYYYKYRGKWYNSDDMWRVDPRTNDGFSNTYGFVPDVQVTQVSISGKIIGDKDALFFAPTSNNYHITSAELGYISDPKLLRTVLISPQNTTINYISTSGTNTLQNRINDYDKKLIENEKYDELIKKADMAFNSKKYQEAQNLYQEALNSRKNDLYAKKQIEESKRLIQEKQNTDEQKQSENSDRSEEKSLQNSFWDDTSTVKNTSSNTTQNNSKQKMSFDEQLAYTKKISEEKNRQEKEKLDTYFEAEKTRLQNEQENKMRVLANSYYANEARDRAEQGISDNASFTRDFENVDDLLNAFYQQVNAINQNSQDLKDARIQQNSNNLDYHWGTSTGTDRAVGEVATGIANIIGQAKAEKERKEAIERLEKEKNEQLARIEKERKQKILNLRNEIFRQFPEGGIPLSKHKVDSDELYFFTYSQNSDKTLVKVSNVFPYAKYKDGTWAFKDKVTAESEKITGNKVTLVGYYTTKALAEKERSAFVSLLPKADVKVTVFEVKGRKQEAKNNNSTDYWGTETKSNTKSKQKKASDFWDDTPTKTDKKSESKKQDDFWD